MKLKEKLTFWVFPIFFVVAVVAFFFFLTYSLDFSYEREYLNNSFWYNLFRGDPNTYRYSLTAAATSLAATLGIMFAIVFLTVQLTANRYTPKVIDLFIKHRMNRFLIAAFIISITYTIWVSHSICEDFIPRFGGILAMILMTACYSIIIPYFVYLFNLLSPASIIDQIKGEVIDAILKVEKNIAFSRNAKLISNSRLEQITDIALGAVERKDSEIAHRCTWAIQNIMEYYLTQKKHFEEDWYKVDESVLLGSPRHIIEEMVKNKTWLEFKALRQMHQIFITATGQMRDVTSNIVQAYRSIGFKSVEFKDMNVLNLLVKFFNTTLRTTIIQNDSRATNDTLYHYRILAERVLDVSPEFSRKIAFYFMTYAMLFIEYKVRQNFESVVYDLRKLNEKAYKKQASNRRELLEDFLRFQYRLDHQRYSKLLKGLWKAYAILGSFYLSRNEMDLARKVFKEMQRVPIELILELKVDIERVTEPYFWEVTDRIINYNFVPPNQKEYLEQFFDWFLSDLKLKSI